MCYDLWSILNFNSISAERLKTAKSLNNDYANFHGFHIWSFAHFSKFLYVNTRPQVWTFNIAHQIKLLRYKQREDH